MRTKIRIASRLRPYWYWLVIAFAVVLAEGAMDLLEPWRLMIVFDNRSDSKTMPTTRVSNE